MRLADLQAEFLRWDDDTHYHRVNNIEEADGIVFKCPKCLELNHMSIVGVHSVICWEPNVPQTTSPIPGRWNFVGSGLDDLSLVAGSSSILLTSGCMAHFFIRNGSIEDKSW